MEIKSEERDFTFRPESNDFEENQGQINGVEGQKDDSQKSKFS